jgi:hypothetical protein
MGRKLILTGTKLTNLSAPKLATVDPMEIYGSMLLVDHAHPKATHSKTTLPANAAVFENLLSVKAKELIGANADVAGVHGVGGSFNAGAGSTLLERTPKGGIHAVVSPTATVSQGYWRVSPSADVRAYMLANLTHNFYISVWGRMTKAPTLPSGGAMGPRFEIAKTLQPSSNYHSLMLENNGARKYGAIGALGAARYSIEDSAWAGTIPANSGDMYIRAGVGASSGWNYTVDMQKTQGGFVHYRFYMEDLTVSGRSYAAADALDAQLYTKQVLTSGGRYYGDTFTDPATVV